VKTVSTAGWPRLGIEYHDALDSVSVTFDSATLLQMAADLHAAQVRGTTPGKLAELLRELASNRDARAALQRAIQKRADKVLDLNRAVSFHVYRAMTPSDSKQEAWRQTGKIWGCGPDAIRGAAQKFKLARGLVWDGKKHDAAHLARGLLAHAEKNVIRKPDAEKAAKAVWHAFIARAKVFQTAKKKEEKS
jgi:hypothetical protein